MVLAAMVVMVGCAETAPRGDPVAGAAVVEDLSPTCGHCHVLESAGFVGTAGPNLDVLQPGYERVFDAVRTGPGLMPSFEDQLTETQMHDLAAYVSGEAGS